MTLKQPSETLNQSEERYKQIEPVVNRSEDRNRPESLLSPLTLGHLTSGRGHVRALGKVWDAWKSRFLTEKCRKQKGKLALTCCSLRSSRKAWNALCIYRNPSREIREYNRKIKQKCFSYWTGRCSARVSERANYRESAWKHSEMLMRKGLTGLWLYARHRNLSSDRNFVSVKHYRGTSIKLFFEAFRNVVNQLKVNTGRFPSQKNTAGVRAPNRRKFETVKKNRERALHSSHSKSCPNRPYDDEGE